MTEINWHNYRAKFNGRERSSFESLSYMLFCYEHNIKVGIFRFKNQTGIETEPVNFNGLLIGFQAKYYDTKLGDNKNDIIDSISKAKSKNPDLSKIFIYTNQEFAESSNKFQKLPKYLIEIGEVANRLNFEIEWRLSSHFEKQLSIPENSYLAQYFFGLNNGIIEFLNNLTSHTENILFPIQTNIFFKKQKIKIERTDILSEIAINNQQMIILSGDGGSGKTALVKDFFEQNTFPHYVFKATEFDQKNLSTIFVQFGAFGIEDFLISHKEETKKIVVIDSAEKLAELEKQDTFIEFLSALIRHNWQLIFTTRNSYLEDLCFQMYEVYKLSFKTIKLDNLTTDELKRFGNAFQFKIPNDEKLQALLCNLFYLREYLLNLDTISDQTNISNFRDILWQKKVLNSKYKKDNIHLQREICFLTLAKSRATSGRFILKTDGCNPQVLRLLEIDEIIKLEPSQLGYFITHDIYEEWALEKLIESEYIMLDSYSKFFENIGSSLPIRRAFRSWLSDKLLQTDSTLKTFITEVFKTNEISAYWKDELLVSILLSDYSSTFFEIFDSTLLENKKSYLNKITFLLRIACKAVDQSVQALIKSKQDLVINPAYVFTKPKGKGWDASIRYLFLKKLHIRKDDLTFILPLLREWTDKHPYGDTTRIAGLLAFYFYRKSELKNSNQYGSENSKLLLKVVLNAAQELKNELQEVINILLNGSYNQRDAFNSLRTTVLTSNNESFAYIMALPESVIRLADDSWYQPSEDRHPFDFGGHGTEQYFLIRNTWSHHYFPASALQTPVYYLLGVAFQKTIDFILNFTNRAVEAYFASGFDSSVHEVELTIGIKKTKQIISRGLWNMYRGTGSPVTPYLLQSIHMALEKRLLEIAKVGDKTIVHSWLVYLLENTRSASITAVVASIVLAYPDELFEIAVILFTNYELFKYDNQRAGTENEAKGIYSIGRGLDWKTKVFEDERLATCEAPHRQLALENLALQYQFFKKENISDTEADKRKFRIWQIIDNFHDSISAEDAETDRNKAIRLLLARIDKRKMSPSVNKVQNGLQIEFNPSLDEDLKKYSEDGIQQFKAKYKYMSLHLWAANKFENRGSNDLYPQYENDPHLVLRETHEIVDLLQKTDDDQFYLFNSRTPPYACAILIKQYSDSLSDGDLLFCSQIIVEYAVSPFREGYFYQIADGLEVSISTLPFLYKLFPENKTDYNIILLLILFDTYPIGHYKRVCDYAIEAINNSLFEFFPEDANTIFLKYLTLKPKFDLDFNTFEYAVTRKSRAETLAAFVNKYEAELEKTELARENYDKVDLNSLEIQVIETAFLLIPDNSSNPIHLDYINKILALCSKQLLENTYYSDDNKEIKYELKHRFFGKYAKFLLQREATSIKKWTQSFVNDFTISKEMADFLSAIVSEEDKVAKYDSFWAIWDCFYPPIKAAVKTSKSVHLDEIIRNYMPAWRYWKETAKDWRSLKEKNMFFYKKICEEIGNHPTVLFSISKFLNEIGTSFLNDGLLWISDMVSTKKNLSKDNLYPDTIYYLEILVRKYIYINRTRLKFNNVTKEKMLVLLNFLVTKGSVSGYMLREEII